MKLFNVLSKLLILASFLGLMVTSCKKEEEDQKQTISFHVDVSNLRDETVYFFMDDGTTKSIQAGHVFTWEVVCEREIDHVAVGVKLANGEVLDQKTVWNGDIYKLVVNKENTGPDVSDEIKSWMFTVDLSNLSSKPIYVFIDGELKETISPQKALRGPYEIFNQESAFVEVKTADGVVLASKKVSEGVGFVEEFTDPVFVINKIVLTKWNSDNLFDSPDPWFKVEIDDEEVSRTDYLSDVGNGKSCTFFDLNIVIDRIYSKVGFRLYDYDTGYSSGSDYISGLYTNFFYEFWGQNTFTLKVSDLEFTVYGTWY